MSVSAIARKFATSRQAIMLVRDGRFTLCKILAQDFELLLSSPLFRAPRPEASMLTARRSNGYRPPRQFLLVDDAKLEQIHQLASSNLCCSAFRAYAEMHASTQKCALQKFYIVV